MDDKQFICLCQSDALLPSERYIASNRFSVREAREEKGCRGSLGNTTHLKRADFRSNFQERIHPSSPNSNQSSVHESLAMGQSGLETSVPYRVGMYIKLSAQVAAYLRLAIVQQGGTTITHGGFD